VVETSIEESESLEATPECLESQPLQKSIIRSVEEDEEG
jgi:hypothetical protein